MSQSHYIEDGELNERAVSAGGTIVLAVLAAKYVHASLAPWCLAAGIKKYTPELYDYVRIIECTINQPPAEVLKKIVKNSPRVVGFSCYIWNINETLALCAELKKANPELIIILGGPEIGCRAEQVLLENEQVDYVLAGEGEKSLPAFLNYIFEKKENNEHSINQVPSWIFGLCGRRSYKSIYQNPTDTSGGELISPLSAGYAQEVGGRIAYFETSRGCPYSCAFCLSGGGKPRLFDLDVLLPDLLKLSQSGTRTIKFVDRTFNANAAHANKILKFILENYGKGIPCGVCFHFEIAGDILREETFSLLKQMPKGAVQLEIGIQSFNEKTLQAVNRKVDSVLLHSNIQRLIAMGNMHIHIDLIAGLPYENIDTFARSFNKAYNLGAHMLQLGFLKLLYGSAMRENSHIYPCEYDKNAPYEVSETPWLSKVDFNLLHLIEDALSRTYNSGRFYLTLNYVLNASSMTPFEFYRGLGLAATGRGKSLDDYTALFQAYCLSLENVNPDTLRDFLVRDRLETNSTGILPLFLRRHSEQLKRSAIRLAASPETAPKKGVRRSIAILNSSSTICFVDYTAENKNPVTGRFALKELPLE